MRKIDRAAPFGAAVDPDRDFEFVELAVQRILDERNRVRPDAALVGLAADRQRRADRADVGLDDCRPVWRVLMAPQRASGHVVAGDRFQAIAGRSCRACRIAA